jgi:hypothetical protein
VSWCGTVLSPGGRCYAGAAPPRRATPLRPPVAPMRSPTSSLRSAAASNWLHSNRRTVTPASPLNPTTSLMRIAFEDLVRHPADRDGEAEEDIMRVRFKSPLIAVERKISAQGSTLWRAKSPATW